MSEQLSLAGTETALCVCCLGERTVRPVHPGMEPEPCVLCRETDWDRYQLDPYEMGL